MEEREPSCTVDGNVNWYSHYGEGYGGPLWSESESRSVMSDSLWLHGLQNTGVGSLSLLQGIFPTQKSNPGLPHCRWILYQLSYEESQTENRTIIWPSNPTPGHIPEEIMQCTPLFIATLFTIARTWKQPKCPSTDERFTLFNKMMSLQLQSFHYTLNHSPKAVGPWQLFDW